MANRETHVNSEAASWESVRRRYIGQSVMVIDDQQKWQLGKITDVVGDIHHPRAVLGYEHVSPERSVPMQEDLVKVLNMTNAYRREITEEKIHAALTRYRAYQAKDANLPLFDEKSGTVKVWKIQGFVEGDSEGNVILIHSESKEIRTVPVLRLLDLEVSAKRGEKRGLAPMVEAVLDEEPTIVSTGAPKKSVKLRYGAVDVSEAVEDRARDVAEERLHREQQEVSGVSGFFAKIFKHNLAYEVFRQWEIGKARKQILKDRNIYAGDGLTREDHARAVGAVVDRFVQEHDDFLHSDGKNGEKRKVFGDGEEEREVKNRLTALVRKYAETPDMDAEELQKERDEIFASANSLAGEAKGRGNLYADNLEKIAAEVRKQAQHAGGLENVELDLEIVVGRAKLGARTEREKNLVDTVMDKLGRYGASGNIGAGIVGLFHNELAVALGSLAAIGAIGTRLGLGSTAAKVASFGGTGVVAGMYGWWKEKSRLNRERGLHERQMALGGVLRTDRSGEEMNQEEIDLQKQLAETPWYQPLKAMELKEKLRNVHKTEQPRRQEMKGFELHRLDAKDCIQLVKSLFNRETRSLRPEVTFTDGANILAEIEARIRVSNREMIDLLRYSSTAEAEVERRDLDVARAILKARLRAMNPQFEDDYAVIYALREGELYGQESENQKQQQKFAQWQGRQARARGVKTAVVGAGLGFALHELWALGSGGTTTTGSVWEWLRGYFGDKAPVAPIGAPNIETIGTGVFATPGGTDLVPQADGSFTLSSVSDGRVIVDGLHIDAAGHLDASSLAALRKIGANIIELDRTVPGAVRSYSEGIWDWIHSHAPDVTHIRRDAWMDNDTPMTRDVWGQTWTPKPASETGSVWFQEAESGSWTEGKLLGADLNELRLWWGGDNNIGVDANGDYVMDMSHMTAGGSFHGAMRVHAPNELLAGKIRLLLSASEGSQNHVVELGTDAQGQIVIPANSDIAKTFFKEVHGKAVFLGKYAEIAVSKGVDDKGVEHVIVLATHLGKGIKEGITSVAGDDVTTHVTQIDLPVHGDVPPIVIPPIVPITPRTPMERVKQRNIPTKPLDTRPQSSDIEHILAPSYYGGYYNRENIPGLKKYFTEIDKYRLSGSPERARELLVNFRNNAMLAQKYAFVLERLDHLVIARHGDVMTLPEDVAHGFADEIKAYNLRYFGKDTSRYLTYAEFLDRQIGRIYRQLENILLEEAQVGEKPFSPDFYKESPLIKGIQRAEEIVFLVDPPIGDSVLTSSIVVALNQYLSQNKLGDKKIVFAVKNFALFECLQDMFGDRVNIVELKTLPQYIHTNPDKERFIINGNAHFEDYGMFGLSPEDVTDTSRVMSVDWSTWTKEEFPKEAGKKVTYDPLPSRILRNFELMFGQKLFADINAMDHFLEKGKNFDEQSQEIIRKYNIQPKEKVIVITAGAGVTPKEYLPERWSELLTLIKEKYPDVHILWLESPDPGKRKIYGDAIDRLVTEKGVKISRVEEGMSYMNTIMSMADLTITPDTGLGHYSSALGKPNVMLTLVNPVQWSTAKTVRVMHRKAYEVYKTGKGTYELMWGEDASKYYVNDNGKMIGASDIPPAAVFEKVEKILG